MCRFQHILIFNEKEWIEASCKTFVPCLNTFLKEVWNNANCKEMSKMALKCFRKPESIMVCLCLRSPTTSGKDKDEAVCNIQHMLLQAFCAESRILMVHVMADASLMRLVLQLAGRMGEMGASDDCSKEDLTDCSLVLIEVSVVPVLVCLLKACALPNICEGQFHLLFSTG